MVHQITEVLTGAKNPDLTGAENRQAEVLVSTEISNRIKCQDKEIAEMVITHQMKKVLSQIKSLEQLRILNLTNTQVKEIAEMVITPCLKRILFPVKSQNHIITITY